MTVFQRLLVPGPPPPPDVDVPQRLLRRGQVLGVLSGGLVSVRVGAHELTIPYVGSPQAGSAYWVVFADRSALLLSGDDSCTVVGPIPTQYLCRLFSDSAVWPTSETHLQTTNSREVRWRVWPTGTELHPSRTDAIVWLPDQMYVDGAMRTPASYLVRIKRVTGLGGIGGQTGANVVVHQAVTEKDLGSTYAPLGAAQVPLTEHATGEDLSGPLLATMSTMESTTVEVTVQRNSRGSAGLHMAVDWAVAGTTWVVPGPGSESIGGYYDVEILQACY